MQAFPSLRDEVLASLGGLCTFGMSVLKDYRLLWCDVVHSGSYFSD